MKPWPAMMTWAVRSVRRPRIGLSRCLSWCRVRRTVWPPRRRCGRPQGLTNHLEAVEVPDCGHDMGRVGALAAPRCDQPQLHQPIQEYLEGHALQVMSNQSGPKLRQHAEIEARIRQRQTQTVTPANTSPQ